jgi:hypothetical protein
LESPAEGQIQTTDTVNTRRQTLHAGTSDGKRDRRTWLWGTGEVSTDRFRGTPRTPPMGARTGGTGRSSDCGSKRTEMHVPCRSILQRLAMLTAFKKSSFTRHLRSSANENNLNGKIGTSAGWGDSPHSGRVDWSESPHCTVSGGANRPTPRSLRGERVSAEAWLTRGAAGAGGGGVRPRTLRAADVAGKARAARREA